MRFQSVKVLFSYLNRHARITIQLFYCFDCQSLTLMSHQPKWPRHEHKKPKYVKYAHSTLVYYTENFSKQKTTRIWSRLKTPQQNFLHSEKHVLALRVFMTILWIHWKLVCMQIFLRAFTHYNTRIKCQKESSICWLIRYLWTFLNNIGYGK